MLAVPTIEAARGTTEQPTHWARSVGNSNTSVGLLNASIILQPPTFVQKRELVVGAPMQGPPTVIGPPDELLLDDDPPPDDDDPLPPDELLLGGAELELDDGGGELELLDGGGLLELELLDGGGLLELELGGGQQKPGSL